MSAFTVAVSVDLLLHERMKMKPTDDAVSTVSVADPACIPDRARCIVVDQYTDLVILLPQIRQFRCECRKSEACPQQPDPPFYPCFLSHETRRPDALSRLVFLDQALPFFKGLLAGHLECAGIVPSFL